jgi:phosphate uptake regulator
MTEEKIRSVFKLGETLVMSLPKSWTQDVHVKKGDKLIVRMEKDKTLHLLPRDGLTHNTETDIIVNGSLDGLDLERKIIAKYVDGFSLINVKSSQGLTPRHHTIVRDSLNKLFGLHIVDMTTTQIVLQSLLNPSELPIHKGIERTHALASSMLEGALDALANADPIMATNILKMRSDLESFHYLVLRQLRSSLLSNNILRRLNIDPIDSLDYLTASQIIIRVARCAEQILKDVIAVKKFALPPDIMDAITSFGNDALAIYQQSVNTFIDYNVSSNPKAIGITQAKLNTAALTLNRRLAEAREEGVPCEVMCHVIQIVDCIKRVADQGIELADTTLYRTNQYS